MTVYCCWKNNKPPFNKGYPQQLFNHYKNNPCSFEKLCLVLDKLLHQSFDSIIRAGSTSGASTGKCKYSGISRVSKIIGLRCY